MEFAHEDDGAAEFLDQGDDTIGGFLVAAGRECGVAVAMAAKVGAGDLVARCPQTIPARRPPADRRPRFRAEQQDGGRVMWFRRPEISRGY
jgi:hypothetical protein